VAPEEVAGLVAAGWVRFPRTRAEKAAGAWPPAPALVIQPFGVPTGAPNEEMPPQPDDADVPPLHEIPVFGAPRAARKAGKA
jgi:hypothetical protein